MWDIVKFVLTDEGCYWISLNAEVCPDACIQHDERYIRQGIDFGWIQ